MGNKDSKPTTSFADWEKIDTDNGIDIYRNKKTNELAEKRAVSIDPHYDLNDQLKIYHMREHNRDALVRTLATQNIDKRSSSEGICSGHKKVFVLNEKMPYRLSELPQLTFPESLLFLREALRAYAKVFKSYGPIHVTKQFIGINDFGQVKCWVNQNWALNHPDHEFPSLQSTKLQDLSKQQFLAYGAKYRDEIQIVHNITAVVQQKCEQGKFPRAFSEQVQLHSSSFKKLSLYLQDFINYNEIFVPPKINYETVFVSKYQNRLVQQQQLSTQQNNQSNKNNSLSNQQSANQQQLNSQSFQNGQSFQNAQLVSNQQSQNYGYGYNHQQQVNVPLITDNRIGISNQNQSFVVRQAQGVTQGPVTDGYTVTKTTTSGTFGGLGGLSGNSGVGNTGQTVIGGQNSLYPANNTNQWTKTQSGFNPPDQNKYSSPYSQYTTNDPTTNYNLGAILGGTQTNSKYQPYKPYPNNNSVSSYNYSSSNNYPNGNNHLAGLTHNYGTASDLQYSSGGENLVTTYSKSSNYQERPGEQNKAVARDPHDYEEFNKIFKQGTLIDELTGEKIANSSAFAIGGSPNLKAQNHTGNYTPSQYQVSTGPNQPSTFNTSGLVSSTGNKYQTYTSSYNTGYVEPTYGSSAEKGSNYSFDGKQDFSSKLAGYSGNGYSNTLAKYQTTTSNNIGSLQAPETTFRTQSKYLDAFNSLISPSLQGNLKGEQANNGYSMVTTQKHFTTNISGLNATQSQKDNKSVLQNLAKNIQRPSNHISQSNIKSF